LDVSSCHGGRGGRGAFPGRQPAVRQAVLRPQLPTRGRVRAAGRRAAGGAGRQRAPRAVVGGGERGALRPDEGHPGQPADGEVRVQPHETPELHAEGRPHEPVHVPAEERRGRAGHQVTHTHTLHWEFISKESAAIYICKKIFTIKL